MKNANFKFYAKVVILYAIAALILVIACNHLNTLLFDIHV